jgi:hypothetical protein
VASQECRDRGRVRRPIRRRVRSSSRLGRPPLASNSSIRGRRCHAWAGVSRLVTPPATCSSRVAAKVPVAKETTRVRVEGTAHRWECRPRLLATVRRLGTLAPVKFRSSVSLVSGLAGGVTARGVSSCSSASFDVCPTRKRRGQSTRHKRAMLSAHPSAITLPSSKELLQILSHVPLPIALSRCGAGHGGPSDT